MQGRILRFRARRADRMLKSMETKKTYQSRIVLVVGIILIVVALLVSGTVFVVMQRHAEGLLSNNLQASLQNNVQLIQFEIGAGFDRTVVVASRPLLIDQVQRLNTGADDGSAREILKKAAQSFLPTGLTAIAVFDQGGRELARAGTFTPQSALTVPLNLPGRVQLMWAGQMLLHAAVDMKQAGQVVGQVITETSLPATTAVFKQARRLGETGDLALCAPLGSNMQCFPSSLNPNVLTRSQRTVKGDLLPMAHALIGKTGFITARDYRQQQVAAAYAPVADLGLGMVLKMDDAELYAPVWLQLRYLIPLLLAVLISALLSLRWLLAPLVLRLVRAEAQAAQRTAELTKEIAERRQAFELSPDPTWIIDSNQFIECNAAAVSALGYSSREELLNIHPSKLSPPMQADGADSNVKAERMMVLAREQGLHRFEWLHTKADGMNFVAEVTLSAIELDHRPVIYCVWRDITERKRVEAELLAASKKSEALLQAAGDGIHVLDLHGNLVQVNEAFSQMLGYTPKEMIGMNVAQWDGDLLPDPEVLRIRMLDHVLARSETFETKHRHRDGHIFDVEINVVNVEIDGKKLLFCAARDITEKKKSNELIWQQANIDTLTGLPNRRMFYDRLGQEIKKSHRSGLLMAVLLLDLDRFKEVNDTLGHAQGDVLLAEAARRIADCLRESDTVARLGGDEFTVILSDLKDVNSVSCIAQKIIDRLAAPFQLQPETAYLSASMGITLYPNDGQNIEVLIKNADQAMYLAKNSGRGRFSYFTAALQDAVQTRLRLLSDLRQALPGKQLVVYYQPIVAMASGKIHKAEALLRWQHPERGMVSPLQFIALAEESGLIHEIGDWVFHEAVRQLKRCREIFAPQFQIGVNKSPVQFRENRLDFESWPSHLQAMGLPGNSLVVEITESLLLNAEKSVTRTLQSFRAAGIQVALDDFGTGYSSLSYLKKFDIDYLKIDQSFVRNLGADPDDQALCEAIIVMAHKLGLKVIAEGVETEAQRALLAAYGCDYAQGWLYSKALPAAEFEALLQAQAK